jgi:pyruvate dehydrogenase E1 component alpha subunit
MEYTPIATVTAVPNPAADRASAYGIPGELIDGNDVLIVKQTVETAARRARAGDGPTLIEALTYRHYGHSRSDPAKYRPQEEVDGWLERDPLDVARLHLRKAGVGDDQINDLDERARTEVAEAVEAAKAAPDADPAEALTDVWADGSATWRTT